MNQATKDLENKKQLSDNKSSVVAQDANFEPKSQREGKKFGDILTYEDIISQTKEIAINVVKTEKEMIEEDSKLRREKIEAIEEEYKNLNAKPLSSIDSYESYNLVLNKSVWNFNEIEQRNTKFLLKDLALQTHIYLYDGKIIQLDVVERTIRDFLKIVLEKITYGNPIVLNPILILDVIRFDKNKIIPITVANPRLLPPLGVIEWNNIVLNNENNLIIIETFIKLLDNALNNGHECEFFPLTTMVRGISGITSLYVSEKAADIFNRAANSLETKPENTNEQK